MITVSSRLATVVVIDDTPDLRLLLRMVLELSDRYTVVGEAGDGAAGIKVVSEWQPDLVLLDLAMPVMDGLEALPGIRSAAPTTKVVVLSGFEADRMAEQAVSRGADGYLQKGTQPDDVVAMLDDILGIGAPPAVAAPRIPHQQAGEHEEIEALRAAVATAAHELRTPSTVLIGLSQTLMQRRDKLDAARMDELLDAIVRQTRVLDRVTADLLTSAQAQRGGLSAQPEPMDLTPALRAAARAVADQTDITVDAPGELQVVADPVRVQQMLTNLVSNAMKYGAAPVSITASVAEGRALVRVDDRGPGVPDSFRPQLFEQYARATGSRASGTGLGLYVVRELATAQGGAAWYEPRIDGGSSFRFTLPLG
ncbi:MAG: response regulator [Frankiaceae bacterium]|nr:response regulator [Frankiaceae bacterium]MBV9872871.1 response regulator [Frankiaceae bacterium]